MSRITAIRESIGHTIAPQRYVDEEETEAPTEKQDIETWSSEARPGLGHRISRARRTIALYGLLLAVGVVIAFYWSRPFVVGVVSSTITQAIAAGLFVFTLGIYAGSARQRSILDSCAWLAVRVEDSSNLMLGEVRTDGDSRIFVPYQGFDWLGYRSRQLEIGELGSSLARAAVRNNPGVEMDDPARIRIDDAVVEEKETAFGRVIVAHSGGLRPDPFANHSDVYLSPPDLIDEQMAHDLTERLRQLREMELPKKDAQITMLEQRESNLREELSKGSGEQVDEFIERIGEISDVVTAGQTAGRQPDDSDEQVLQEIKPLLNGGDEE